jgi:very-long-chain enoyl-CoA reductase
MVVGHYAKREFESAFIHTFSHGTMPVKNIFKNSSHYWVLGGLFIAYYLYHPLYTPVENETLIYACTVLFTLCEVGNLLAHITLKNLRPPGSTGYYNPTGGMFELVACANYTYEVFAWFFFCIMTNTLTGWFFLFVSTAQIAEWANKKHRRLVKLFPKTAKRKRLFPFIW